MSDSMTRRLPVYLLLDTSGSMMGERIESVRQGMKALISELKVDPQALETAYLSVITFDSHARQVVPLTELLTFQEPRIEASGSTALGEALKLLEQCIDQEVRKAAPGQKGDWKPLIFLMTDGMPTDSWESPADKIKKKKVGNLIACAAGSDADETVLKRITEIVVRLNSVQPEAFRAFFKWVSSSIKTTSQSVAQVAADTPINLPPPPPQIQIVP
ncbi:MAG: VWA domain-containing protein [Candidatus Competibacteraceae bacterium]